MIHRRNFLHYSVVSAGAATLPLTDLHAQPRGIRPARSRSRMRSLEGVPDRHLDVWRIPGRFTKNPDIVRFPAGKMMLGFCDVEQHWTEGISRITTLESLDGGKKWGNPRVVDQADTSKGEERWVTPRISLLRDGRLVVICDHDDFAHYHEDQAPGNWVWFSSDEGQSWSKPHLIPLPGIEPDRIVELDDGTLLTCATVVHGDTQKEAMVLMRSKDGITWTDPTVMAKDYVQNYTEGGIIVLSNGLLACVMRNENHKGYPSFVVFSTDHGYSWSQPRPMPFCGDRPYGKQLSDGRVLVTYRNQGGNRGTHAWIGDLANEYGYQIYGTHYDDRVTLENDTMHIHNKPNAVTRYTLLPPESFRSDVGMETTLRVAGPPDRAIAKMVISRIGVGVEIGTNGVWLRDDRRPNRPPRIDEIRKVDMTREHRIGLYVRKGLVTVKVDGKTVIYRIVRDELRLQETWFGRQSDSDGEVWWRNFTYYVRNATEPDHLWNWQALLGRYPDQYQLDRMLEVHANPPLPNHNPDNGYSSWVELPDGRIFMVDYTNRGDPSPTSHLYGVYFSPEDFEQR